MSVSYPSVVYGDNFEAQKLNTVGRRAGMSCIYKVLLKGERKRAGVYIQDNFDKVFIINVGGDNFQVDLEANTITYNPRYSGKYGALVNDPKFMEVVQLTLVRFGHIKVIDGQFSAPPPRLVILTEEEQESIGDFGIF